MIHEDRKGVDGKQVKDKEVRESEHTSDQCGYQRRLAQHIPL
jgi:hypothetical protein